MAEHPSPNDYIGRVRLLWNIVVNRKELVWLFSAACIINVVVWELRVLWYPYSTIIPLTGLCVIGLNTALALLLLRKEVLLSQALAVTAIMAQVLLLILIIRTGTLLH